MVSNANEILFRASGCGYLMTEARSKSETISETTKTHLVDVFVSAKYGRKEDVTGKMLEKGNVREEDSITLYARAAKRMFKKNEISLQNEFIKGTPDVFLGPSIENADEVIDLKTSWSAHTFFRAKQADLNKLYYWQLQAYCALTGAKKATVAFCLVNGTYQAIMDEKRKASWQFGQDYENDLGYIEKCKQIELNHIFDPEAFAREFQGFDFHNDYKTLEDHAIPMAERIHLFEFERNDEDIRRLYQRVVDCRTWMNKELFKNQTLIAA